MLRGLLEGAAGAIVFAVVLAVAVVGIAFWPFVGCFFTFGLVC